MIKVHEIAECAETRIPANKQHFFKNILLATDFSPASERALEFAASLARRYGSTIYLTHIITLDGYPLMAPEFAASSLQKMHDEAEQGFATVAMSVSYSVLVPRARLSAAGAVLSGPTRQTVLLVDKRKYLHC